MNIRMRRLQRDYEKITAELAGSEYVKVEVVSGNPPDHYAVSYNLSGIMWDDAAGTTAPIGEHIVDIYLPLGYPRQSPRCVMRTPIWHPNIGDYVCIGDYWSAGVTLVDIIAHIGDMIQYKTYNLHSPVSKPAALWAQQNIKSFPIGVRSVLPPENNSTPAAIIVIPRSADAVDIELGPMRERS